MSRYRIVVEMEVEAPELANACQVATRTLWTQREDDNKNGGMYQNGAPQKLIGYEVIEAVKR